MPRERRAPGELSIHYADTLLPPVITRDAVKETITEVSALRDAAAINSKAGNARKNNFLRWIGFEGKIPVPGIAGVACAVAATVIITALVANPFVGPIAAGVGIGVMCVVGAIAIWRTVAAHRAQKEANIEPKAKAATAEQQLANLVKTGKRPTTVLDPLSTPVDGGTAYARHAALYIAPPTEAPTPSEALPAQAKIKALKVEKDKQFKRVATNVGVVCGVAFFTASIGAGAMTGVVPAFVLGVFVAAVLAAGISLTVAAVKRYMNDKHVTDTQIATQERLIRAANDSKDFPRRAELEHQNNARLRREIAALQDNQSRSTSPTSSCSSHSTPSSRPVYSRVQRPIADLPLSRTAQNPRYPRSTFGAPALPPRSPHLEARTTYRHDGGGVLTVNPCYSEAPQPVSSLSPSRVNVNNPYYFNAPQTPRVASRTSYGYETREPGPINLRGESAFTTAERWPQPIRHDDDAAHGIEPLDQSPTEHSFGLPQSVSGHFAQLDKTVLSPVIEEGPSSPQSSVHGNAHVPAGDRPASPAPAPNADPVRVVPTPPPLPPARRVDPNIELAANLEHLVHSKGDIANFWITTEPSFRTSHQAHTHMHTAQQAADGYLRQKIANIPCIAQRAPGADLPANYVQLVNDGLTLQERNYIQSIGRDVNAYIPAQSVTDDHAARRVLVLDAADGTASSA